MHKPTSSTPLDRRTFLTEVALLGAATVTAACSRYGAASSTGLSAASLRDRIGLQLFTVRDRFPTDYPGTLKAVAGIGYREVQTTQSYGQHTPEQIKSYLDAAGLIAPTTHVSPPNGADFERTLEGYQLIGHRYTTVRTGGGGRPAGAPGAAGGATGATPRPAPPADTLDSVKRTAEALNQAGRITQKHGIKVIVHNHTEEFAPLADSSQRPYDVLLAETDPSLVAMELDIGWAAVAGVDARELFRQTPGRFEVWHVKDATGLSALAGKTQVERHRAAKIVAIGEGEIDYRSIFTQAGLAGMKHFYVEQDSAPQSGDSLAAAATSYRNLLRVLG